MCGPSHFGDHASRIKVALKSKTRDIGILWVRGHIGIAGNEKANTRAEVKSRLGISGKAGTYYTHVNHTNTSNNHHTPPPVQPARSLVIVSKIILLY